MYITKTQIRKHEALQGTVDDTGQCTSVLIPPVLFADSTTPVPPLTRCSEPTKRKPHRTQRTSSSDHDSQKNKKKGGLSQRIVLEWR